METAEIERPLHEYSDLSPIVDGTTHFLFLVAFLVARFFVAFFRFTTCYTPFPSFTR